VTRTYSRETVISKLVEAMATEGPTPFAARCGVALPTLYAYRAKGSTRTINPKVLAALGLVPVAVIAADAPASEVPDAPR